MEEETLEVSLADESYSLTVSEEEGEQVTMVRKCQNAQSVFQNIRDKNTVVADFSIKLSFLNCRKKLITFWLQIVTKAENVTPQRVNRDKTAYAWAVPPFVI